MNSTTVMAGGSAPIFRNTQLCGTRDVAQRRPAKRDYPRSPYREFHVTSAAGDEAGQGQR